MTGYDKIKLAIYERADIDENERYQLLELLEERQNDNAQYVENAITGLSGHAITATKGSTFLTSYKKAAFDYKRDIKDIKRLIKGKEFAKAREKINVATNSLHDLAKVVENAPNTLTDTCIVHCLEILKDSTISYIANELFTNIVSANQDKIIDKANKIIDAQNIPDGMAQQYKTVASGVVKNAANGHITPSHAIQSQAINKALKIGAQTVIFGKNIKDTNSFKIAAKKQIMKDLKVLKKLQNKLDRKDK